MPVVFHSDTDETVTLTVTYDSLHVDVNGEGFHDHFDLTPQECYGLAAYVEWLFDESDRDEPNVEIPDDLFVALVEPDGEYVADLIASTFLDNVQIPISQDNAELLVACLNAAAAVTTSKS